MTKKSLGQHWLKDERVVQAMIEAAHIKENETVLEIGPGKGVLTKFLIKTPAKVVAIEKDQDLIEGLETTFKEQINSEKLKIYIEDILSVDISKIITDPYKVVANIPYYITGAILRLFLQSDHQPVSMTLLMQKEVVDRIMARDGKESLLSLSVKAYGIPNKVLKVPARSFQPAPKVDSAVLHINNISKDFFTTNAIEEDRFFEILHKAFNQKRKQLRNTLAFLSDNELGKRRPESLSLEEWLSVYQQYRLLSEEYVL